jgi:biopolymer transport protein ExbD
MVLMASGCAACPGQPAAEPAAGASDAALQVSSARSEVAVDREGRAAAGAQVIAVDAEGRAWIDGQPVASDEELAARAKPSDQVTLAVDARVPHGRVMAIIDRLRAAGIAKVAFAVAPASEPSPPAAEPSPPPLEPPTAPPAVEPAPAGSGGSLPEVIVENVGLHIGGGPNDDASKAPFLRTVQQHFPAFRACYVKAEEPRRGGTFGADLFIGKNGGKPEVRQPRTGLKGAELRDCLIRAFEQIQFDKPPRGPTVVSYSIRFRLE